MFHTQRLRTVPSVTTGDRTMKPGYVEHALHMMQAYLVDCAKEKDEGSNRCTEQLNRAIRACVESLAVDRRDDCRGRDPRLPDALSYAIRYVDEHLDAELTWDDMAPELGTDAFAFGRRIKLWTGTRRHGTSTDLACDAP